MDRIERIELPPFQAAIAAGVRLVMTAHIVLPALGGLGDAECPPADDGRDVPATLSPAILRGLLRRKLRFDGLIVTDAMDMGAIDQGPGLAVDAIAAVAAGVDLLLFNQERPRQEAAYAALVQAARRGLLSPAEIQASARRVLDLKKWLRGRKQPPLGVVGCREHRRLAREVAEQSVTLVRDRGQRLPLRLPSRARVAVVVPRPQDLTPADTSSHVVPALAAAVRRHHTRVDEFFTALNPSASEVRALRRALAEHDLVILGTINATAQPGQAALVKAVVTQGTPAVAVALRMPYDLTAYPMVPTYACTYSILPPSMEALAEALWGRIPFPGRLPVRLREEGEGGPARR